MLVVQYLFYLRDYTESFMLIFLFLVRPFPESRLCYSIAQMCPTLFDPMDCSMPGLPVHHQLLELAQTHVQWVSDAIQPSHPLSSPSPPVFPMSQFVTSSGQSIGASTSASVLPMNIQDWFPLGWTVWISLQSNGLSRAFSNTTVQTVKNEMLNYVV